MRVLLRGGQYNGKARFDTMAVHDCAHLVIDLSRKRTMASLDEMSEPSDEDARSRSRPRGLRRWSSSRERGPRRGCRGAAEAGAELPRGADAALPRGDVVGRDCQRDACSSVHVKSRLYRGLLR